MKEAKGLRYYRQVSSCAVSCLFQTTAFLVLSIVYSQDSFAIDGYSPTEVGEQGPQPASVNNSGEGWYYLAHSWGLSRSGGIVLSEAAIDVENDDF